MNARNVLLAILSLNFFIQTTFASTSFEKSRTNFLITVSAKLIANYHVQAVQVSNLEGKILHHEITSDYDEEEDLKMQFEKGENDKVMVSLFYRSVRSGEAYIGKTFVNIENGTYLDDPTFEEEVLSSRGRKMTRCVIRINDVTELEDLIIFTTTSQKLVESSVEDGVLTIKYYQSKDNAIYGLIKSNLNKKYRYFYDSNTSKNYRQLEFDYKKLQTCNSTKRIDLPESEEWIGSVKVKLVDEEKPFTIFSSRHYDPHVSSFIEFPVPTKEFDFVQVNLRSKEGNKFRINKIYSDFPSKISDPDFQIDFAEPESDYKLEFTASDKLTFYKAVFGYRSKDGNYFGYWNVIGIDREVVFTLPVIAEEILNELPKLPFNGFPVGLEIQFNHTENYDAQFSWIMPFSLLEELGQLTNRTSGNGRKRSEYEKENISVTKSFSFSSDED